MAQMKQLLIELIEFEDEIIQLLMLAKQISPVTFALLGDEDLSSQTLTNYFEKFTTDKELVGLTVAAIEFDVIELIAEDDEGQTILSLKIPKSMLTNTIV